MKERIHPQVANLVEHLGRLPKPSRIDEEVACLLPKRYGLMYVVGVGRRGGRRVVLTNTAEGSNHLLKPGDSLLAGLEKVGGRADVVMVRDKYGKRIMEIPVTMVLGED